MSNVCDRLAGSAELALRANGVNGDQLQRMAYAVAHGYCRRTGTGLDTRIDDLAQWLALTASRKALGYKPPAEPGYSFVSYLFDIMEQRCPDFFRQKGEGFGDRRYSHDGRIVLMGEDVNDITLEDSTLEDDGHEASAHWRRTAALLQQTFVSWPTVTERRVLAWTRAAEHHGYTLDEWLSISLDHAARSVLDEAA